MLVSMMIAQVCAGMVGSELQACSKALEAAGVQSGVTQNAQRLEDYSSQYVIRHVTSVTGDKVWIVVGTAARVVRDRSISYPIKRNPSGIIPSVVPTIGVGSGTVNFGWRF